MMRYPDYISTHGRLGDSFNDILLSDVKDMGSFSDDKEVMNSRNCNDPPPRLVEHTPVEVKTPSDLVYRYILGSSHDNIHIMEPTPIGPDIDIVESFEHEHVSMESWRKLLETLNQAEDVIPRLADPSISHEEGEQAILGSKRHQDLNISDHTTDAPKKRQKLMTFPWIRTARLQEMSPLPSHLFHCSKNEPTVDGNGVLSSGAVIAVSPKNYLRDYHVDNWESQYEKLVEFRAEHGNCFVPNMFPQNPRLSMWVKRQRYQHKLKLKGRHHTLTKDRQTKLDALGFIWDSHKAIWEERYSELLQYRKAFGRTDVPFHFHNKKLAVWVKCQRRQYRMHLEGKQSSMTPERITKLNRIDFEWTCRDSQIRSSSSGHHEAGLVQGQGSGLFDNSAFLG